MSFFLLRVLCYRPNSFLIQFLGAVFNYPPGAHNVFRVDGTAFQQCAPPANSEALTNGNDVINLLRWQHWVENGTSVALASTVRPET